MYVTYCVLLTQYQIIVVIWCYFNFSLVVMFIFRQFSLLCIVTIIKIFIYFCTLPSVFISIPIYILFLLSLLYILSNILFSFKSDNFLPLFFTFFYNSNFKTFLGYMNSCILLILCCYLSNRHLGIY